MTPDVQLTVNGQDYGGWLRIGIDRSIEQCAGAFELEATERWSGQDTPRAILPGAKCTLGVDGLRVISGYVDDVEISYDDQSHTMRVRGRDATGDLVDCAAIHKAGAWKNRTLSEIAEDLCKPFGVGIRVETPPGDPFPDYQIQEGETVFECLERAARLRAVLLRSDGTGNLVISRAGSGHMGVVLELGQNLLRASGNFSHAERYSEYVCKGQRPGSDTSTPEQHRAPAGKAMDAAVKRYRPMILLAEDNGDGKSFSERAAWERNIRFGRSTRIRATVVGWTALSRLWEPNRLVRYADDFLGIHSDLLIASVRLNIDEGGQIAELELVRPEAFSPETVSQGSGSVDWKFLE